MSRLTVGLIISLLTTITIQAQKPLEHLPKTYVSPEGKLFVQKDLPLYLWISTDSSNSSKKYLLQSEETKAYANPMYLDTEGYNSVRSPSAVDPETRKTVYPLRDIVFEMYADGQAPITKVDYGEGSTYMKEQVVHVGSKVTISLKAKDALSGVEKILVSQDGGAWQEYSTAIQLTDERQYSIKYYAVDNVGNPEEMHTLNLSYDRTAPKTSLAINKDEHSNILSGRSKIDLTAEDEGIGVAKIYYRIDDGNELRYTKPVYASALAQGEHKLVYYSVDHVGNKEAEQVYSFYVDKTPPTIIEEIIGKSFYSNGKEYSSGKTRLKLTAFDNKAGVKEIWYSINNGEFKKYDKPVFLTQASGKLIVNSYAVDNVNNKSNSQTTNNKASIPYIDLTGPSLKHTLNGVRFNSRDTVFVSNNTKIQLLASDKESGVGRIEYQINEGEYQDYTGGFTIRDEGVHFISFTAYDNVENSSSDKIMVKVDTTGPVILEQFSAPELESKAYPKHVILFLSAVDDVVGLERMTYSINNGTAKAYTAPISGFATGSKIVKVYAYDKLGNQTVKEIEFTIE